MTEEVVLVHGLWLSGWTLAQLARRLAAGGVRARTWSYPTVRRDLDGNAAALAAFLRRRGGGVTGLVGHSLGGLVALRALELDPGLPVRRLLMLGSPLNGSAAARGLARLPGGRTLLGASLPAALAHGPHRPPRPLAIGMIAGSAGLGAGRLLARFGAPSDGAVAVAETRWDGLDAHLVLPVSHLGMLASGRVARCALRFLRGGPLEDA